MELKLYISLFRKWLWLLLLGALLGGAVAYVVSIYQQPVYQTGTPRHGHAPPRRIHQPVLLHLQRPAVDRDLQPAHHHRTRAGGRWRKTGLRGQ